VKWTSRSCCCTVCGEVSGRNLEWFFLDDKSMYLSVSWNARELVKTPLLRITYYKRFTVGKI
jgi:hypothetical protein